MIRRLAGCVVVLAVAFAPSAAQAAGPVAVTHAGWFWGNPQPQGNDLADIDLQGARGYAVGEYGTVLRTDDAGATWMGLRPGTEEDLSEVRTIGPNTVFAGGGCALRRSDDGGASFTRLPFTARDTDCPSKLTSLSFTSPAVGYVLLGDGTVLRTSDGGRTFAKRTSVPGAQAQGDGGTATDIDFVSADTGTAVAGGRIYRTINGGNSWTAVTAAGSKATVVDFVDPATAVAVGGSGTYLVSSDGGASFTARPLAGEGAGKEFTGVSCASASSCLMTVAGAGGPPAGTQLVRTGDGGATSSLVTAADSNVIAADFGAAGRVLGVGDNGVTVASDDAGATFAPVGGSLPADFDTLRSAFGARAYAPGPNGRVARTVDGGRTWSTFGVPTAGSIIDVSFPVPAIGFALDAKGSLLRTDNAGETWRILDSGADGNPRAVIALDARRVAVIGPRGVRRSTNGGNSFGASRSKAVRRVSLGDVDRAGSSIVAWGSRRLVISRNGGNTWSRIRTPKGTISSVDFLDRRNGFLVQGSGRVYATRNGGRRWRQLRDVGDSVDVVSFADKRHGYALPTEGGSVLRTDDGGRTWEPQRFSRGEITSVLASTASGALAASAQGQLFGTATGGHLARSSRLTLKVSRRKLRRPATVRVTGRLTPASPGSQVALEVQRGSRSTTLFAEVASNGSFSARVPVKRGTTRILAQWRGDDRLDGDGTSSLKVVVGKRR